MRHKLVGGLETLEKLLNSSRGRGDRLHVLSDSAVKYLMVEQSPSPALSLFSSRLLFRLLIRPRPASCSPHFPVCLPPRLLGAEPLSSGMHLDTVTRNRSGFKGAAPSRDVLLGPDVQQNRFVSPGRVQTFRHVVLSCCSPTAETH